MRIKSSCRDRLISKRPETSSRNATWDLPLKVRPQRGGRGQSEMRACHHVCGVYSMEAWREKPKTKSKGTGTSVSLKPPARQEENQESTMWGSLEKGGLQGGVS